MPTRVTWWIATKEQPTAVTGAVSGRCRYPAAELCSSDQSSNQRYGVSRVDLHPGIDCLSWSENVPFDEGSMALMEAKKGETPWENPYDWLVVTGTMEFYNFPYIDILGMSEYQLTNSYFSEELKPPTRFTCKLHDDRWFMMSYLYKKWWWMAHV